MVNIQKYKAKTKISEQYATLKKFRSTDWKILCVYSCLPNNKNSRTWSV